MTTAVEICLGVLTVATHFAAYNYGCIVTLQRCKRDVADLYAEAVIRHAVSTGKPAVWHVQQEREASGAGGGEESK